LGLNGLSVSADYLAMSKRELTGGRSESAAYRELRVDVARKSALKCFAATPLSVPVVVFILAKYSPLTALLLWAGVGYTVAAVALFVAWRYREFFGTRLWGFGVCSALLGVFWGAMPFVARPSSQIGQTLVLIVVVAVASVAASMNTVDRWNFRGLAIPPMALGAVYLWFVAGFGYRQFAPFALFYYVILAAINGESRRVLDRALDTNFDNQKLLTDLEAEHRNIASANKALTDLNAQLTYRNHRDPLTGLYNRAGLVAHMNDAVRRATPEAPVAVLYLDLDGFKLVNDSLGHEFGDELLRVVGRRFSESGNYFAIARLGGDEFCALLSLISSEHEARSVGHDFRRLLEDPISISGRETSVTVSVGVALGRGNETAEDLRRSADIALYQAKADGRNQVVVFDTKMQTRIDEIATQGSQLRTAFDEGRVRPWFQPEIDLHTNKIIGAEALARWIDGANLRAAGDWMAAANEVGLSMEISDRMVANVIQARSVMHRAGMDPHFKYWMNIDPRQIDRLRLDLFVDTMMEFDAEPGPGGVEVTEVGLIRDLKHATVALASLRERGVSVALDDFGTGNSSLSLLQHLPIDAVKIDRSFVRNLAVNNRDRALVRAIISMASELDISVIAEGVETEEQADILRSMGCKNAQGFLYSAAVEEASLISMLSAASVL
jgi:diguanylate cyclase (GGDEF)-like protein